jgi:hypothetical protein
VRPRFLADVFSGFDTSLPSERREWV